MGGIQLSDEEEEETMMDIVETLPSAMANNAGLSAAAVGQEEEEEDDELEGGDDSEIVLQEFNVHISHQLASALHLMQYPTRHLPFKEHSRPTHGRIKPQSRLIEMELSLDTEAAYFDRERAGLLGVGLDNKPLLSATDVKNGGKASENGMLQSQTLASCILPNAATYMIGVLRDGKRYFSWCIYVCSPSTTHIS